MKIDLIEKTKELEDVESSLSTHERFDNYFSIFNRVVSFYQLALESLAKRLPVARTFLDALCQSDIVNRNGSNLPNTNR